MRGWRQNGRGLETKGQTRRGFPGLWSAFFVSGGSRGHSVGLMAALQPSLIWAGLGKTLYSYSQLIESDGNAIDSYARAFFELKGIYILFDATIHEKKINIGYSHHFIYIILLHLIISKYVEHTNLMFLSTAIQISEFNLNSQEQAL